MFESPLALLVLIVVVAGASQWLAWRVQLPSILLLLAAGFVLGPVTGVVQPEELFGRALPPLVSLAVAIILFAGGLTLRFSEIATTASVVWRLVTVGALVTWAAASAGAYYLLELPPKPAILLGAILIVTGPTTIIPLLRHVRPTARVASVLRWEGIVIDPVGATIAVLVFEVVAGGAAATAHASHHALVVVARTVCYGGGVGTAAALLLMLALRKFWIPDYLRSSLSMAMVMAAYAVSHLLQNESGLLAVTLMGVILGNQRTVDISSIAEFKENLEVFLIGALFILLSARLKLEDFADLGWQTALFVAVLIFAVRPLCILASTLGSSLPWKERWFLMVVGPRGIVAAAVASVFVLELERHGITGFRPLVTVTFTTIVGTVLFSGLVAGPLARRLGLADRNPQGLLIAGAGRFARMLAEAVRKRDFAVLLIDTNADNVRTARLAGLPAVRGSVVSDDHAGTLNLAGLGRMLAMTSNDEVNLLAVQHFRRVFGQGGTYQVAPRPDREKHLPAETNLPGRRLFHPSATANRLEELCERGWVVKVTRITEEFTLENFQQRYGEDAIPLLTIEEEPKRLIVHTATEPAKPKAGQLFVSLVPAPEEASS
jgi:NhaP-type Na+/H+ or K+/H+ antiporter